MEPTLLAYGISKGCYCYNDALQNTKIIVRSFDGDTEFFDIVVNVTQ